MVGTSEHIDDDEDYEIDGGTLCNYCTLFWINYRSRKKGLGVTTKHDNYRWISVYVHPSTVTDLLDEHRVASMMKVTNYCVC